MRAVSASSNSSYGECEPISARDTHHVPILSLEQTENKMGDESYLGSPTSYH